jgi:transcriptional regulator NrdR family protein
MQVRVLPIAQQRRESRVEKCESHSIVKGDVERSTKEDGTVIRKRRCDVCGDLIRTIEMTEDQLAHIRVKFENQNRALRAEMAHYRAVAEGVKRLFAAEERVRKEMMVEHEITEEDQL